MATFAYVRVSELVGGGRRQEAKRRFRLQTSVIGGSRKYKYLIKFNFLIFISKLRIFLYGQLYLQSLEIVIEQ